MTVFAETIPEETNPYADYPCLKVGDKYFFSIDLFFKNEVKYTPQIVLDCVISSDIVCQEIVELSNQKNSSFSIKNNDPTTLIPENTYRLVYTCDESLDENEFSYSPSAYSETAKNKKENPSIYDFHGLISLKCWTKHPKNIFNSEEIFSNSAIRFARADFAPLTSCESNSKTEKFLYQIRKSCLLGDCNADGMLGIADAVTVARLAADKGIFSFPLNKKFCLVNSDNVLDVLDASQIQKYTAGKDIGDISLNGYDILYDGNGDPLPEEEIVKLLY